MSRPAVRKSIRVAAGIAGAVLVSLSVFIFLEGGGSRGLSVFILGFGTLLLLAGFRTGKIPLAHERTRIEESARRYGWAALICFGLAIVFAVAGEGENRTLMAFYAAFWLVAFVLVHFWLYFRSQLRELLRDA